MMKHQLFLNFRVKLPTSFKNCHFVKEFSSDFQITIKKPQDKKARMSIVPSFEEGV